MGFVPQMTQIYADGYATGCCLWDSAESVGDYYIRFAHGVCPADDTDLHRWLRYWMLSVRFCGSLWETIIFASLIGLSRR